VTSNAAPQPDAPALPESLPPTEEGAAPGGRLRARWARVLATGEAGMSTAEYAVGTVAACAFAAVLYRVVTGGSVVDGLSELVSSALATLS
jgi:glutathione S-transferase